MATDSESCKIDDFVVVSNVCDSIGPFSPGLSIRSFNEAVPAASLSNYCTNSAHSSFDNLNENEFAVSVPLLETSVENKSTIANAANDDRPCNLSTLKNDIDEIFHEISHHEEKKAEMLRSMNKTVADLAGGEEELLSLKNKSVPGNEIRSSSFLRALGESLLESKKRDKATMDAVQFLRDSLENHISLLREHSKGYFTKSIDKLDGYDELQRSLEVVKDVEDLVLALNGALSFDLKVMDKLHLENESLNEVIKVLEEEMKINEEHSQKRISSYRQRIADLESQILSTIEEVNNI